MVVMNTPPAIVSPSDDACHDSARAFIRGADLRVTYTANGAEIITDSVRGEVLAVRVPAEEEPERHHHEDGIPTEPVAAIKARSAARARSGAPVGIPGL